MGTDANTLLAQQLREARGRTLALIDGLNDEQLMGPCLPTVNPLRWEIGHTAYFHEFWIHRGRHGLSPERNDVDQLFDSIHIAHDDRWHLPLPPLQDVLSYMQRVLDKELELLAAEPDSDDARYLYEYALYHEDMHTEAFTYTRQTLNYPRPIFADLQKVAATTYSSASGDTAIPGGTYTLGARPGDGFCFDNEKWGHELELQPFRIARTATSNGDFLQFVEADGYNNRDYWDEAGWAWKLERKLDAPVYWRLGEAGWEQRHFQQWRPLDLNAAIIHVSWYEAQAWCRWANRRLPTEAEWELAASGFEKRRFPWGDAAPTPDLVNMDANAMGTIDVNALPDSDSPFGCRQMIGNCWEWTSTTFEPFPGFTPDMYADYSQPLFGHTKVLRGGAWASRSRMLRNTWRTYYGPDRNDVFCGFRSCSL